MAFSNNLFNPGFTKVDEGYGYMRLDEILLPKWSL